MEENKFDFKFLNKTMYIIAFVVVFFALREFGILAKIGELLVSLTPFYIGVIICWMSKPLANKIRKLGVNKGISAILALIIIFAVIILALSYIIPIIVTQVTSLIKELPNIYTSAAIKINSFIESKMDISYRLTTSLGDLGFLAKYLDFDNLLGYSLDTVSKIGSLLVSFITAIMISFFMVKDMDKTKNNIIVFASKNKKDSNRYKMLVEMDEIINSYIRGLLIDSVLVGILTVIMCMILKLQYAVVFGILITFLNLIPYIGAVISYTITTVYAFTVGGPVTAIITLICSVCIQFIDANILQPNIIGKSVNLHPVLVICGLLVFGDLFGIVGMILAMPILAIGKIYIKYKFGVSFESQDEIDMNLKQTKIKRVKKEKSEK